MTDAECVVLHAIVHAEQAWSRWVDLDPVALATLESSGWIARWDRSDYLAVTLTPWGAERLGVEIREHWCVESVEVRDPTRPRKKMRVTVAEEIPAWRDEVRPWPRACCAPRYAREVPLRCPERLVDPHAPQVLCDDDGEPVTLFGGHPILIDRRLG